MKDVWHLRRIDWLREFTSEEREALQRASGANDYGPGEMIFSPEPNPNSVYLLEAGLVRIFRLSAAGSETTFGYVAPGEVFGELAGFGDYPRESFAQTVRKSRAWKVPRATFQEVIRRKPDLAMAITRQIGERLKRIESRIEDLVFRDVRSRVAHILLELAEDFGESGHTRGLHASDGQRDPARARDRGTDRAQAAPRRAAATGRAPSRCRVDPALRMPSTGRCIP
jgi:CRP-like cAMP-binding protein